MFKRLSALFVALIMGLSLMTPAFAADDDSSTAGTGTITVYNIPANYDVNAYQIIQAAYDDNGEFLGWEWTQAVKAITVPKDGTTSTPFADSGYINEISLDDFNTIVAAVATNTSSFNPIELSKETEGSGDTEKVIYSNSTMSAGSYIIMAAQTDDAEELLVFNPMIASINFTTESGANVLENATLNATGSLTVKDGILVNPDESDQNISTIYAKVSEVPVTKEHTVTSDDPDRNGSAQGQIDDDDPQSELITYTITTKTPDYRSAGYLAPTFTITDTLSKGLSYEDFTTTNEDRSANLSVKIGNTVINIPKDADKNDGKYYYDEVEAFTVSTTAKNADNGGTLTINFTKDFLKSFGSLDVIVTYNAKLNEDATSAFDPNTNTVEVKYSNDPTDTSSYTTIDDEDRVYTFTINGNLLVGGEDEDTQTAVDFIKTGKITTTTTEHTVKEYTPLAGAKFTLYSDAKCKNALATSVTGDNGMMVFEDLGEGTYYLKETAAPAGYVLDSQVITVTIKATYKEGVKPKELESYAISFKSKAYPQGITMTYTAQEDTSGAEPQITIGRVSTDEGWSESTSTVEYYAHLFENSTISELPSTGSYGTYAFILIGCVIMAAAVTIYFQKRKVNK